jgi:hypothetical protein
VQHRDDRHQNPVPEWLVPKRIDHDSARFSYLTGSAPSDDNTTSHFAICAVDALISVATLDICPADCKQVLPMQAMGQGIVMATSARN